MKKAISLLTSLLLLLSGFCGCTNTPAPDVSKMFFATTSTSISNVFTKGGVAPAIRNGRLSVKSGAAVQVYSADGRSLSPDATFTPGIYLVKVNGQTFKVTAQ